MNKGFTLAEVLAVITILGFLLVFVAPKILDLVEQNKQAAFAKSASLLINGANTYMNSDDKEISLPAVPGEGKVISAKLLKEAGLIKNYLEKSVVVIYNNNNYYEYYVFAANDDYIINGYQNVDLNSYVEENETAIDFTIDTAGVTSYSLAGVQLTY